ncbi:Type 1 glutamine amidotransferase-like domain-containing protein [Curtobacterium sp. MCBD17_040]|uniref:Type 1 glutamine amidotransferase-like domain-containing protein n=1 Tax=Curtobacterium sp. MCBD17_040 TaxID=2175674 RepID=UPI000DA7F6C2|nr:Type 1 glutamine amidotransferase-like domain-containing protein [Curtobacterium sp. MCBD17_040]WIB62382.1 Type 1 glutamine amidotransferase-like domain-containing protein [Curtobacterium sp. MCBD17_040]
MSVHLVGGGTDATQASDVYGRFLAEATQRGTIVGRSAPRVAVLAVGAPDAADTLVALLGEAGGGDLLPDVVAAGATFDTRVLNDVDGLVIAGGRTPDYVTATVPLVDQIRLLVADSLPYLGYSAGAMIAADRALVGGFRVGGVDVSPEWTSEGLDEVTLQEGLGLVDLAIDVHAAQAGTLSRLVAAAEAGVVAGGVAIDEDTVLIVGEGALEVRGSGSVWRVIASEDGEGDQFVSVATIGA